MNKKAKQSFICIAAGGSGGHVMPAVSVAHEFLKSGYKIMILTDQRARHYWPQILHGFTHIFSAGNIRKKKLKDKIVAFFQLTKGFLQVFQTLKKKRPDVMIAFGGYPTLIPLIWAYLFRIPITLVELDQRIGIINRIFRKCAHLRLSAHSIKSDPPFQRVGLPVRPQIDQLANLEYQIFQLHSKIQILITGGSQAARCFAFIIPRAVALLPLKLRQRLLVFHQSPSSHIDEVQALYKKAGIECSVRPFFSDIDKLLVSSHLIICRSGASTLAELAIAKRPAILVPYPHASENHQYLNALPYAKAGAAWIIEEKDFTTTKLAYILNDILTNHEQLVEASKKMEDFAEPHAAQKLVQSVIKFMKG